MKSTALANLPCDVLMNVLSLLPLRSLVHVTQVARTFSLQGEVLGRSLKWRAIQMYPPRPMGALYDAASEIRRERYWLGVRLCARSTVRPDITLVRGNREACVVGRHDPSFHIQDTRISRLHMRMDLLRHTQLWYHDMPVLCVIKVTGANGVVITRRGVEFIIVQGCTSPLCLGDELEMPAHRDERENLVYTVECLS